MGMVVRSNIMAINANRQLGMNNSQVGKSLEKLASGYRINRAGDDASGLAISEKMKAQIRGLETASANSQDGISLVQTAEGALTEVHDMLNRMVELAGKSANGTMDDTVDRASLQKEMNALKDEINRIAEGTNFNGTKLLDGSLGGIDAALGGTGELGAATMKVIGGNVGATSGLSLDITIKSGGTGAGSTPETTIAAAGIEVDGTALTAGAGQFKAVSITGNETGGTVVYEFEVLDDTLLTAQQSEALKGMRLSLDYGTLATAGAGATFAVGAGDAAGGLTLQVGDTAESFNKVTVSVGDMSCEGLGIDAISVASQDSASAAIDKLKNAAGGGAINIVSGTRADLGALQNRLEHTINNLDVAAENMSAANSRIRDTDMAKQMMEYTKMNVLTQAAQAMLAQANMQPQSILQLLQ